MSTMTHAVLETATMTRRNLLHGVRYPSLVVYTLVMPIAILWLFTSIFGHAMGASLGGDGDYLAYLVPGLLIITVGLGSVGTAVHIAMDNSGGMMGRLRTLPVSRASIVAGPVIGSVIQAMVASALFVGAATILGYRPGAGATGWLGVVGMAVLVATALTWLAMAIGLSSANAEAASNNASILMYLPFLSSGFVPAAQMTQPLRTIAEYQPFTPVIETLRGLLSGGDIGNQGWIAVAWCLGLAVVGYAWTRWRFERFGR